MFILLESQGSIIKRFPLNSIPPRRLQCEEYSTSLRLHLYSGHGMVLLHHMILPRVCRQGSLGGSRASVSMLTTADMTHAGDFLDVAMSVWMDNKCGLGCCLAASCT